MLSAASLSSSLQQPRSTQVTPTCFHPPGQLCSTAPDVFVNTPDWTAFFDPFSPQKTSPTAVITIVNRSRNASDIDSCLMLASVKAKEGNSLLYILDLYTVTERVSTLRKQCLSNSSNSLAFSIWSTTRLACALSAGDYRAPSAWSNSRLGRD